VNYERSVNEDFVVVDGEMIPLRAFSVGIPGTTVSETAIMTLTLPAHLVPGYVHEHIFEILTQLLAGLTAEAP
jgi:hypothetical protein